LNFHVHLRLVGVHFLTVAAFPALTPLSIVIALSAEPRNGNSNLTKKSDRHHRPNSQHYAACLSCNTVMGLSSGKAMQRVLVS